MPDLCPPRSVVYLCPGSRCDIVPYTYYRHAPPGLLLDVRHQQVAGYQPEIGREILRHTMRELSVDPDTTAGVVLGGSAFSLSYRFDDLKAELATISARLGVPVITDMVAVIDQLRRHTTDRVVVAHRLAGVSDDALVTFLDSAGLTCVDVLARPASMTDNAETTLVDGARTARDLTATAISRFPDERALLLLGGSWWVEPAAELAQRNKWCFVNNVTAVASAPDFNMRGNQQ
ncbi:aspartate racemase/maleate isomerase family protein [Micromonospora craniellae]|uniref:Uncharacterized protein n=1 Tax=Micromonospora craniellae TaxID=2294034 RepID=A0A372FYG9_9ACTN|nr:hypothetical protein [Micromonospora craniellae]QOC93402.1 hypothetical protein ID554_06945 [Micromonospora craniellae]RFS45847.1 hypothetical protein D0Q02_14670 [Micromonospora craniellae]